ncbi:MAG: hypothetical protein LBI13_11145 [Streptococcaceae bacterium]|jgi:hypothetical protein|nr:hypothetical protein [Streptococcaceae bacterium]
MGHFGIYTTDPQNVTVELPVTPEEITFTCERTDGTVEILKLGEVNLIGKPKLMDITITASLPVNPEQFTIGTAQSINPNGAKYYIPYFQSWQNMEKSGRLTITDTVSNIPVTISKFEFGYKDGNIDEYVYTLTLKEWRDFGAKKVNVTWGGQVNGGTPKPAPPVKIGVGSTVIVNGQLFRDSYGNGGGQTERNAKRKVNFVTNGRKCPYHVTDLNGGWRGWVTAASVRLA